MSHQHGGSMVEHSGSPYHWVNGDGLSMRMQVFLTVRNEDGEVALVQLEKPPGQWWIPAETLKPNEPVTEAAKRVSETWFGKDLGPEIAEVKTFTDDGHGVWYQVFIFEARAEADELEMLPDTVDIRFLEPGTEAPGPLAMDHGSLWPELSPDALRV